MRSALARPERRFTAPAAALLCVALAACAGVEVTRPPREEVPQWETPPVPDTGPSLQQRIAPDLKPIRPVPSRPAAPAPSGTPGQAVPDSGLAAPLDESDPDVRVLSFVTPRGKPVTLRYRQRARSVGSPTFGHLEDPRCLPAMGPGWVRPGSAGCGTDETVTLLQFAIGQLMADYPGTVPVVMGALSMPTGGRLRPHKSHRTGRDVDLGFFREGNVQMKHFEDIPLSRIDYEKSFWLMAILVSTGRVQNIFVNYALQAPLYQAARGLGYDDEQLAWLFQYPRGRGAKVGVIRHSKGHKRHFHVRFVCPSGDGGCVEEARPVREGPARQKMAGAGKARPKAAKGATSVRASKPARPGTAKAVKASKPARPGTAKAAGTLRQAPSPKQARPAPAAEPAEAQIPAPADHDG